LALRHFPNKEGRSREDGAAQVEGGNAPEGHATKHIALQYPMYAAQKRKRLSGRLGMIAQVRLTNGTASKINRLPRKTSAALCTGGARIPG
jgi:hypothetical protein